jgi:hypothetical protein
MNNNNKKFQNQKQTNKKFNNFMIIFLLKMFRVLYNQNKIFFKKENKYNKMFKISKTDIKKFLKLIRRFLLLISKVLIKINFFKIILL